MKSHRGARLTSTICVVKHDLELLILYLPSADDGIRALDHHAQCHAGLGIETGDSFILDKQSINWVTSFTCDLGTFSFQIAHLSCLLSATVSDSHDNKSATCIGLALGVIPPLHSWEGFDG